ncbi:MAG: hypothetical protein ACTHU0_36510 [Kofleriaceae bacterium]
MELFREVNGEGGRGAAPSAEGRAEAMELFREVNGGPARGAAHGEGGRGGAPSAEGRAEAMELFREVNDEPGRGAAPSAEGRAEAMELFREVNDEGGRGGAPSAEGRAEALELFREVNDEPGRGGAPSAEGRAEAMELFREVNGEPGRGAAPSAEGRAEAMELFREVNDEPGRGAAPSAEGRAEAMELFREVNSEPGRGGAPSAEGRAEAMDLFREVNSEPGRGGAPSAEGRAEAMELFREVNDEPGRGAAPSAEGRAEAMQMFREVNAPAAHEAMHAAPARFPSGREAPSSAPVAHGAMHAQARTTQAAPARFASGREAPSSAPVHREELLHDQAPRKKQAVGKHAPATHGRPVRSELPVDGKPGKDRSAAPVGGKRGKDRSAVPVDGKPGLDRGAVQGKSAKTAKDAKGTKDAKLDQDAKGAKDAKLDQDAKGAKDAKLDQDAKGAKDAKPDEGAKDAKDGNAAKADAKHASDTPDDKGAKDAAPDHDAKDGKDAKPAKADAKHDAKDGKNGKPAKADAKHDAKDGKGGKPAKADAKHAKDSKKHGAVDGAGDQGAGAAPAKSDDKAAAPASGPKKTAKKAAAASVKPAADRVNKVGKAPLPVAGGDEIQRAATRPGPAGQGGGPARQPGQKQQPGQPTSEAQKKMAALREEAAWKKDNVKAASVAKAQRVGMLAKDKKVEVDAEISTEKSEIQARKEAARQKAEQDAQQETQTAAKSIDELKEQLEKSVQTELQEVDAELTKSSTETKTQLEAEKKKVQDEAKLQIDNLRAQQLTQQEQQIKQQIEQKKADFREQADSQHKLLVEQSKAEKQKVLDTARNEGQRALDESTKQATDVETKGNTSANAARSKARTEAAAARAKGQAKAASARAEKAKAESESTWKKLTGFFSGDPGASAIAEADRIANDLIAKGDLAAQKLIDQAKSEAEKIRNAGKDKQFQLKSKGDAEAQKIDGTVQQAFTAMEKQKADAAKKLEDDANKQIADAKAQAEKSCQEIQSKADAAATKIDAELAQSDTKLAAERAKREAAINAKAEATRAKLANAKEGDLQKLQKQVQRTIKDIDKQSVEAEKAAAKIQKQAVAKAKKEAEAQLTAIAAEAEKALSMIDSVLEKTLAQIEATAQAAEAALAATAMNATAGIETISANAQAGLKKDGDAAVKAIQDQATKATSDIDAELAKQSADMEKMKDGTPDPELEAKKKRDEMAKDAAAKLDEAMDGWGTDEAAIYNALRGKSPEEVKAIKEAYKAKTGKDLEASLKDELSGDELREASSHLSGDPVQAAVGELRNSGGFFGGDKDKMQSVLSNPNLTPEQKQKIFDEFESQTGKSLHTFFKDELGNKDAAEMKDTLGPVKVEVFDPDKPPPLRPGEQPPDRKAMEKAASELRGAMDGWGTDEAKIEATLKGKSPAEIHAIRKYYKEHYGVDLVSQLEGELSGTQLAVAKAALKSDPVKLAAAMLEDAADGLGTDEKKIQDTLAEVKDPAQRRQLAEEFQKRTGMKIEDMVNDEMSGMDKDLALAYADGDETKAAAIKLDQATNGGFLVDMADGIADTLGVDRKAVRDGMTMGMQGNLVGQVMSLANGGKPTLSMGTDAEKMYDVLSGITDPVEREKVKQAYKDRTGVDLDAVIDERMSGAEKDAAQAYMQGDLEAASAARMKAGADTFWGTDEKTIFAQLEGKPDWQRKQIIDAYNAKYGGAGGQDFNAMLADEMSGLDLEKAHMLAADGKVPPEFEIEYALDGLGTDEESVKNALRGKSAKEIEAIRASWDKRHPNGPSLDAAIKDDMPDGRDGFEVGMMLEGEPQPSDPDYAQKMLERAERKYNFERSGGLSNGVMDMFSDSGQDLDREHAKLEELRKALAKNGALTPEQQAELDIHLTRQDADQTNYVAAKNAVTENLATGAALVVGVAVSAVTAGAAAPFVVAALGALAGGAASMGVKAAMQGGAYGIEDMGIDAAKTILQAATAGGMKYFGPTLDAALKAYGPTVAAVVQGALAGGIGGVTDAAFDETASRDLGDWLKNLAKGGAMGALGGGVGGAFGTIGNSGGKGLVADAIPEPTSFKSAAMKGAMSSVVGAIGTAAVDPSMYEGSWEDIGKKWGMAIGQAAIQGAGDGVVEMKEQRLVDIGEIAQQHVAQMGGDLKAQREAYHAAIEAALNSPAPANSNNDANTGHTTTNKNTGGSDEGGHTTSGDGNTTTTSTNDAETHTTKPADVDTEATTTTTKPADVDTEATTTTTKPVDVDPDATTTTTKPVDVDPDATTITTKPVDADPDATTITTKPVDADPDATTTIKPVDTETDGKPTGPSVEASDETKTQVKQVVDTAEVGDLVQEAMAPAPTSDIQQRIDATTGVTKADDYETDMADLRTFYARQEAEAQNVVQVKPAPVIDQMIDPATGAHLVNPDGTPYGYHMQANYDVREFSHGVTAVEVRVALSGNATPEERARLMAETQKAVDAKYNHQHQLTNSSGDPSRLHVEIVFVDDPANAHTTVAAMSPTGGADRSNQTTWFTHEDGTVFAHEIGHQLNLPDEYIDPVTVNRQNASSPGVHQDGSLMGNFWITNPATGQPMADPNARLHQRHLDQLSSDINGQVAANQAVANPAVANGQHPPSPQGPSPQGPDAHEVAKNPQQLAAEAQQRANQERADSLAAKQAKFDEIDQLARQAKSKEDWEQIRKLEHDAGRPVSERYSPNDEQAALQAMSRGTHPDGTPVTAEELAARQIELDPKLAAEKAAHEQQVTEQTKETKKRIAERDAQVTDQIRQAAVDAPVVNGRREITIDQAISLGMGGAGATGAKVGADSHGDGVRTDRIGIEDGKHPELWGTLGHKPMGQEANAISYGSDGAKTSDFAQHPTAQVATAAELALQVATQRDASKVGTVGSDGPAGPLEYNVVTRPDGTQVIEVGVPVRIQLDPVNQPGVFETVVIKTQQGVDLSTGMGPARQLSTEDAKDGSRKAQISPQDAAALSDKIMSGEAALSKKPETFEGQRVLGIGGGPTSEWAMEHALKGGAASVEVAGQIPRPGNKSDLHAPLQNVEAQIRALVDQGKPVPAELTQQHHAIITQHVSRELARLNEIDAKLEKAAPREREKLQQERDRLRASVDPFLGSRVDRNHQTLNNEAITHVQADVIKVRPTEETLPDGTTRQAIEVVYADGTSRIVDQVIPSIGADADAPGGINQMLKNAPKDMEMLPVISGGRVVGLESNPPGISVSGAAMVATLGHNMPEELFKRIPADMRDAVLSSIVDHANRDGVSDGSRGIVPGIENVGANTQLTIEAMQNLTPEQRQELREKLRDAHKDLRDDQFEGEERFGRQPRPEPPTNPAEVKGPAPVPMAPDKPDGHESSTAHGNESHEQRDGNDAAAVSPTEPVEPAATLPDHLRAQFDAVSPEAQAEVNFKIQSFLRNGESSAALPDGKQKALTAWLDALKRKHGSVEAGLLAERDKREARSQKVVEPRFSEEREAQKAKIPELRERIAALRASGVEVSKEVLDRAEAELKILDGLGFAKTTKEGKPWSDDELQHAIVSSANNVRGLGSELDAAEQESGVIAVGKKFVKPDGKVADADVVADHGKRWIDVKDVKPFDVGSSNWRGDEDKGKKGLKEQIQGLLDAANNPANAVDGEPPVVQLTFPQGVTQVVHDELVAMGVRVKGEIVDPVVADPSVDDPVRGDPEP